MKVLLIDVNCKNSSTGKIVYDLYTRLRQDGHRCAICYGRGPRVDGQDVYKFGLDWETNLHAGIARLTGLNGCFSPFSTGRMLRFMEDFQPDVVHIHELHAYFVNIGPVLRYLKRKNIPVVWTFHCAYMYTGKCGVPFECEKWRTDCKGCPRVQDYPKSLLFDFAAPMLRWKKKLLQDLNFTVVTPSHFLGSQVQKSFLRNKPLQIIPNGIDTKNTFYPRSTEQCHVLRQRCGLQDKKLMLSVAPGIMTEQKGGGIVLSLSESFVGENVHFVLIGAKEDAALAPNVTVLKRTADQKELALWYSTADVFLICSQYENFPTTCLEAMCCGTPVAGFDNGGTGETVPEPYGKFVRPGDMQALKEAVLAQMVKKADAEAIATTGAAMYDKDVMYRAYLELYQKEKQ